MVDAGANDRDTRETRDDRLTCPHQDGRPVAPDVRSSILPAAPAPHLGRVDGYITTSHEGGAAFRGLRLTLAEDDAARDTVAYRLARLASRLTPRCFAPSRKDTDIALRPVRGRPQRSDLFASTQAQESEMTAPESASDTRSLSPSSTTSTIVFVPFGTVSEQSIQLNSPSLAVRIVR